MKGHNFLWANVEKGVWPQISFHRKGTDELVKTTRVICDSFAFFMKIMPQVFLPHKTRLITQLLQQTVCNGASGYILSRD